MSRKWLLVWPLSHMPRKVGQVENRTAWIHQSTNGMANPCWLITFRSDGRKCHRQAFASWGHGDISGKVWRTGGREDLYKEALKECQRWLEQAA